MSTSAVHRYTLQLSDHELARYRVMAARAEEFEEAAWALAGILPGARVADVGCGPGIILTGLARAVAPGGSVEGIDQSSAARAAARAVIQAEALDNATVRGGDAVDTGLEPDAFDVVMQRHVLLHNGGREQEIVSHLASRLRPGGALYLVEADIEGIRRHNQCEDIDDLCARWRELMRRLGHDPRVGTHLDDFVRGAGLDVTDIDVRYELLESTGDARPAAWAARRAIVEAGLATDDDIVRWDAAFARYGDTNPLIAYVPLYRVVGCRPAAAA